MSKGPIYKLRRHANGRFYLHWTEGRRSKHETTGTFDEAEAEVYRAHRILQLKQGKSDVMGEHLTVAELWELYFTRHVEKQPSAASTRYNGVNLLKHFGWMRAADIDQAAVDAFAAERAAGTIGRPSKPVTVRRELAVLRAALNWCANPRQKILDPALLPVFDLTADSLPRDRWLRTEEVARLLAAAVSVRTDTTDRIADGELFLRLALETAARREAIMDLTWDRVDLETGVIHLNVPGRKLTKKRRADVPISASLRPILIRARQERRADAKVVRIDDGDKLIRVDVRKQLARIATEAKVTGLTPHVLRHTAATHMARRGVSLWKIAKILGNTIVMVEKVYAKHAPEDLQEAVDTISGLPAASVGLGANAQFGQSVSTDMTDSNRQADAQSPCTKR